MRAAQPADVTFGIQTSVYIAGVFMPHSDIVITTSFSALPQAVISLPAYPELYGMGRLDRIPVHVFIMDNFGESESEYKLFFEGVIIGFGYQNTALGRSFIIQCESIFNILHKIHIRHITAISDLVTAASPGQSETEFFKGAGFGGYPLNALTNDGKSDLDPKGGNLAEYPTQILENLLNFIKTYDGKSVLAQFYKTYFELIKLLERIKRVPIFDDGDESAYPTLSFLENQAIAQAFTKRSEAYGQHASLFDWVNGILNQMECEFCFINAPIKDKDKVLSFFIKPMLYDALPPTCNIMFRSMVTSIQANENVSEIPTRLRAEDLYSPLASSVRTSSGAMEKFITVNCYPTDTYGDGTTPDDTKDQYTTETLASEEFTGPIVRDVQAPVWWSYMDSSHFKEGEDFLKARLQMLKSMYMKAKYEGSRLSVTMAFNPYIVCGLPGVVFDPQDNGFGFIGLILSVQHDIHKSGGTTSVEMGFVRSLEEESRCRLLNTIEEISEVSTNIKDVMDTVYMGMIGCNAVKDIEDLCNMLGDVDEGYDIIQAQPKAAYNYNYRDIVSQKEFMETFMEFSPAMETVKDDYENELTTQYIGPLLSKRFVREDDDGKIYIPDYRQRLLAIQLTEVDQYIYGYVKE